LQAPSESRPTALTVGQSLARWIPRFDSQFNRGAKMHYYQFNIGDYAKSTKHLTLLEDLAYRRLLDIYYDTEKPLISNVKQLARIAGMSEYIDEITNVLSDFFTETEEGFTQKKAACEIEAYQAKAGTARVNGKLGGRPKKTQTEPTKTQPVNSANPDETGLKPNYKPLTINQEPLTNNQLKEKTTPVKLDYSVLQMTKEQCADVIRIRKKNKGTSLTQLIIDQLAKQFLLAKQKGFTFNESLTEWEFRGWKSFKSEWMKVSQDSKPAIGKTQEIFNQLSEINYDRR
jgi:uncharacterized protein YdaU (DUF1376 family)